MKIEKIGIGEKIDLHLGKGPYYRTVIEDEDKNGLLHASVPTYRGIPIILRQDQALQVFYYRDNGRFAVKAKVAGFDMSGNIRIVKLQVLSAPERQQRRESYRVSTMLKSIIRPYSMGPFPKRPDPSEEEEMEEAPTFNISATGVAVRVQQDYVVGERIFMQIFLEWPAANASPIHVLGEVRQVTRIEPNREIYQLGIMFLEMATDLTNHLARFVLVEDQRRMKQQRLIEDD